jgi:hypothetical protein
VLAVAPATSMTATAPIATTAASSSTVDLRKAFFTFDLLVR